jgi:hypothetical protein
MGSYVIALDPWTTNKWTPDTTMSNLGQRSGAMTARGQGGQVDGALQEIAKANEGEKGLAAGVADAHLTNDVLSYSPSLVFTPCFTRTANGHVPRAF